MNKMRVIGLMSGTSLDGLDLVDVTFWERDNSLKFCINNSTSIPYSKEIQTTLKNCFEADKKTVHEASIWYGEYLGKAVNRFKSEFQIENIDFIASHGHTIFHKPEQGITVQIGDGQVLSDITGMQVICDFRTHDVALGGQGAPLVPIGDQLLFSEYAYCLNLGGFANISFDENGIRRAYDICPINIVLNHFTRKIGLEYDDGGKIAKSGDVSKELLDSLNNLPFYAEAYPKSLGYEFVINDVFPIIDRFDIEIQDILRTYIEHVIIQLAANFRKKEGSVLITGGGTLNTFLVERLRNATELRIEIPSKEIIDFKEALIFGLLGYLRKLERVNCLSSVTGASRDHSSGDIFNPKSKE